MFLDEAVITVRSGSGGDGCVSFRREKYIPRGGPDGGDGGRGGSIYLRANRDLTTLADLSRQTFYVAGNGARGSGNNKSGRSAEDLELEVPAGTLVREVVAGSPPREGPVLGELVEHGGRLLVARGGRGGYGNKHFATSTRQAPREAEDGQPGEERKLYFELKLLADVGLVGLPNAGKSTLLSRISAATPKIADYPFTTLQPNLGIAEVGGDTGDVVSGGAGTSPRRSRWEAARLVVADIPGLIEGAHRGAGLGIEFLRHVERTQVLVHLVSVEAGSTERFVEDLHTVENELSSHSATLRAKPRIIVLTKLDVLPPEERQPAVAAFSAALGQRVLGISAATGEGVRALLVAAQHLVLETRNRPAENEAQGA